MRSLFLRVEATDDFVNLRLQVQKKPIDRIFFNITFLVIPLSRRFVARSMSVHLIFFFLILRGKENK